MAVTAGATAPLALACSEPDGDALTYEIVSGPTKGTLSGPDASGQLPYSADSTATGSDNFTYRATDRDGTADTVTVAVDIAAVSTPPGDGGTPPGQGTPPGPGTPPVDPPATGARPGATPAAPFAPNAPATDPASAPAPAPANPDHQIRIGYSCRIGVTSIRSVDPRPAGSRATRRWSAAGAPSPPAPTPA